MTRVISDMSMSLDGYVNGPGDSRVNPWGTGAEVLHDWIFAKKTDRDGEILQGLVDRTGAVIMGRRSFDTNEGDGGWGDGGPVGDTPVFVVTHEVPTGSYPSVFTFVTDGVRSAIAQAKAVAGDKNVHLHGATTAQQALALGLLDEINVHIVPVLLDGGIRLFEHLGGQYTLERLHAETTPGATHLRFRVVR
ncbi:dihydrofolate reductase family protein [Actinophytocola oryzae]|uniref:Dihydrofolate reductase n=1 Tax=Actinophytocola oryzae TaxID=502181 RepID=A0A4R7VRQ6_9PSEU|nr:dihydrofolate reductase family protein [Actinophytocola oryzae]TDV52168.1 dihydrofolate reductase [Actinophytocola oryzae]